LNKVYNIFGYKMRLNWFEAHHMYWGILIMLYGIWGCLFSYRLFLNSQSLIFSSFAVILQGLHISLIGLGVYVARDDIEQHHKQVDSPYYHSEIHYWYRGVLPQYPGIRWINQKVDWLLGRPALVLLITAVAVAIWYWS